LQFFRKWFIVTFIHLAFSFFDNQRYQYRLLGTQKVFAYNHKVEN